MLIDRAEPGTGGASYGNAGHIAAEFVEYRCRLLQLLLRFWRELFAWGGALDIPLRQLPQFMPWALRFASGCLQAA